MQRLANITKCLFIYLLNRLKEMSTWRAIIWIVTAFELVSLDPEQSKAVVAIGMALAGGVGLAPDKIK